MASLVESIESALAGVAKSLPDATSAMIHLTETGDAIRSSSVEITGTDVTESGAVEKSRVIVKAADFPSLKSDALVTLDGVPYLVTSIKTDPVFASATIGLSEELSKVFAHVTGVRGNRPVKFPVEILAENNGPSTELNDSYAPTTVYSWTLAVAVDDWPEATPPQISDEFRFDKQGEKIVRVARCNRRDNCWVINARSR